MALVTKGRTFVSGEVVTPTKLNSLVDSATVTGIVDADIAGPITGANKVSGAALIPGTVPQTAFAPSVILVPTGAVMPFAMNSAPTGWLAADGTAVSRVTFSVLFDAIGTLYGAGDGSTTFNLPDLRASFVRGAGSDGVATAGAFGVKQADAFQGHQHSATTNAGWVGTQGPSGNGVPYYSQAFATVTVGNPTTDGTNGTPRTANETRPRNIAMLYCIKF